jgi:predicted nucleic acid-binding protein
MPGCVVDASVAVKWVLLEEGSDHALAAIEVHRPLVAPTLVLVEVANAIRKRVRAGQMTAASGAAAFIDVLAAPMTRIELDDRLAADALGIALELAHPVADCVYLALAMRSRARVLTADRKFVEAVRRRAVYREHVMLLGE